MDKIVDERRSSNSKLPARGGKGDASVFLNTLEEIRRDVPYTQALVITTLPRGSLQIVQPPTITDGLIRAYSKEFHAEDRLTWQVIEKQEAIRLGDAWKGQNLNSVPFYSDFLDPLDLHYGIAAPLEAPILDGYPGAIHLYRDKELGDFSEANLRALGRFARALDDSARRMRASRPTPPCNTVLRHTIKLRQFVFNERLQLVVRPESLNELDIRLKEAVLAEAKQRLAQKTAGDMTSDRVPLADSRGDLWNFRVVVHRKYPALGEGPFVFFCQQPECNQWGVLRASDFQADPEMVRIVPALKYMLDHVSKGPRLNSISQTVDLSPFHFHRRFTELLGITPKHFLLDCQIDLAKRLLVAGGKALPDVAKACGFAHQSHFTSRFKQATGLTPTRWRRLANDALQASRN